MKILASLLLLFNLVASHDLQKEWTTPKKEGDKVPQVNFVTRTRIATDDFDWKVLTTDDLFKNKRVVVFALPGAFTPTCSSTHLPGYEEKYDEIKAQGIDEVYCKCRRGAIG